MHCPMGLHQSCWLHRLARWGPRGTQGWSTIAMACFAKLLAKETIGRSGSKAPLLGTPGRARLYIRVAPVPAKVNSPQTTGFGKNWVVGKTIRATRPRQRSDAATWQSTMAIRTITSHTNPGRQHPAVCRSRSTRSHCFTLLEQATVPMPTQRRDWETSAPRPGIGKVSSPESSQRAN